MKITIGSGILDTYSNEDVTISFQIQVVKDVTKRIASVTDTFTVPRTKNNITLIDPIVNGVSKFTNVSVEFESGYTMDAVLYVNSGTYDGFGDSYKIKLIANIVEMINSLADDGIEELFDGSDDFKYVFTDDASYGVPTAPSSGWFFLTAANMNGVEYDNVNSFPVYADRFIDTQRDVTSQLLITTSIYKFFDRAFSVYGIPIGFSATDEVMNGVTMDDLYLFFPVKLTSTDSRTMWFDVTSGGNIVQGLDSLNQTDIQPNVVTSTADTMYNIVANGSNSGKMTIELHHYDDDGTDITPTSGYATVILRILKDGDPYREINIASFGIGADAAMGTSIIKDVYAESSTVEFLATTELTFEYKLVFNGYGFQSNQCQSGFEIEDGEYDLGTYYCSTTFALTCTDITIEMQSAENISPATRINASTTAIETISMYDTMAKTGLKIKDVMNDVLKRLNSGLYEKADGTIAFGNFINRYATSKIKIPTWENGFEMTFNHEKVGVFDYKNRADGRAGFTIKDKDGGNRMLGDVIEQNLGGDKDETLSLKSSYVSRNMYSDEVHSTDTNEEKLLGLTKTNGVLYGRTFWGIPYNEEIDRRNVFYVGFLGNRVVTNIRIPYVQLIGIPDDSTPPVYTDYPTVTFIPNGNDGGTVLGNNVTLYEAKELSSATGANLYLGNSTGKIDNTTVIYNNFIPLLNPYDNYIVINTIIDNSILDNVLSGYIITLVDTDGTETDYYPLEVNGVSLELEKSIAEIKLVKK